VSKISCNVSKKVISDFQTFGLAKVRLLSELEAAYYSQKSREWIKVHRDSAEISLIRFLSPSSTIRPLHPLVAHTNIVAICKQLLGGGEAILDGAALFYVRQGSNYQQGWHRDTMQIDDEEIDEKWFSNTHFHNNVQINIALITDECFQYVFGSHRRELNDIEKSLFAGARMTQPNAPQIETQISLKPGEAVFYNNLGIHRGWNSAIGNTRITIQLGFHSSLFSPTWHFAALDERE